MIDKKILLVFAILIFALAVLPISFADDVSDINQTDTLAIGEDTQIAIDDADEILSAEKDIYVAKNGSNSGDGSESNPYGSLEKALSESTASVNNIYVKEGIYNEYSLDIKSSVNIIGLGDVVFDSETAGPLFKEVTANEIEISLKNITVKNTYTSTYGGVLYIRGYNPLIVANVTFDGVTFINCYSKYSGAVLYDHGGSQAASKNNIYITNCNFINCSASQGPILYLRGNANIINSTFTDNKYLGSSYSASCIGFYAYSSSVVSGCIFENNYADSVRHESGAIYSSATNSVNGIAINNNVFINNSNYQIVSSSEVSAAKMNIENNWWGTNNPNATLLNRNIIFNDYAVLDLTADPAIIDISEKSAIKAVYYINGTTTQNKLIPNRNITLTTTGGNLDDSEAVFQGEFETNFSASSIGKYTITANVDNQQLQTTVNVRDLSDKTATLGEVEVNYKDVTIAVTVAPSSATGNVTFTLNGKEETIELNGGKGNITLYNVPVGEYDNVILTYNGDANHNSSFTVVSFMVYEKYPSELTSDCVVAGSDVTINVEVAPSNATGNVTFTINGNDEVIYLTEGKGNITIQNLPNANYTVELTYNGDENYQTVTSSANFTVLNRIPTELTVTPVVEGDNVTIIAKVNETHATGTVTFTLRYRTQVIELENGEGNITVTGVYNGIYNLTFTYSGDINYNPSNTTEEFTVSVRKDTVLTAEATVKNQRVTIDVDIDQLPSTGNVTFTINGEEKVINITRSKGSITLEDVPYDNYSILLTYNGDINYNPSTYTLDFEVIDFHYNDILYVSKNGSDSNNGSADYPLLTVSKAIDVANNYPNVYKIYIFDGEYEDSDMTINVSIDIEGESQQNTIIDAQGGFLFEIYGLENNVSFTNLTLKNGYNENGGAIRDYGYYLNVTNCLFENNTASDQGGAVYHYYGLAYIENSEFNLNKAITGGALYIASYTNLTIVNDCIFNENSALSGVYAGGAIYNAGRLYVNASEFNYNKALNKDESEYMVSGGDGGAIYTANQLFVNNSQFTSNRAYYWGGAIKVAGYAYIYDSNFTDNSAGSRGGAIHTSGSGSYSAWTTLISGCNFESNLIGRSAYDGMDKIGGAICGEAPTAIRDSNFTDNYARDGGAIYFRANAKFVDNCSFIDNSAQNGGAIYDNRTQSIISNSNFENNNATLGGAIYISASRTSSEAGFTNLTANTYYSNSAEKGGVVYSDAGYASPQELNIKYSEFIDNTASEGSLIYTLNRATIEYNAIVYDVKDDDVVNAAPECEGLVSLENNWWGINNPDLDTIVNGIVAPDKYAVLNLTANPQKVDNNEISTITAKLIWNDNMAQDVELIPFRNIDLKVADATLTNTSGVLDTEFVSEFSSANNGTYRIRAYVDNEILFVDVVVNEESEIPKENVTLDVSDVEITEGETAQITVYLPEYATGNVTVGEYTADVKKGKAIISIPDLAVGDYSFDVLYSGDDNYNTASAQVNVSVNAKIKKNATITANNVVITEGQTAAVSVILPGDATGQVSVNNINSTVRNGVATVSISDLALGNYTFDVVYYGDENYNPASTTVNVTVNKGDSRKTPTISIDAPSIEEGETATVTVTLPSDATGNVTIGDTVVPLEGGVASAEIPNLPAGRNTIDIYYSGDENYKDVSTKAIVTVNGEIKNAVYVNASTGSDEYGNGSKDNPVKTIAKALSIVEDNGTIIMNGHFKGTGNVNLGLASGYYNITFLGVNNTIIDGEHRFLLFSITDGLFTFKDITFQNAYSSGYGAAIVNQAGYVFVENCTFLSNIAQGSSAIDNTGYLVVIGSNFTDNIATIYDGGALSSNWEAYIINSTFTNNRAYQNGGAMKNYEEGYLYIEGCEFYDNIATGSSKGSYGGAVYSWASDVEIFLSTFRDNVANTKGGAVYASYGNSFDEWHAVVRMSEFEGNEAPTGSTLFLELVVGDVSYNAFLDDSDVIYTYGDYAPIDNNWWGVNDPDWSSLLSGTIKKPASYAVLNVKADEIIPLNGTSSLKYEFFWNGTTDNENVSLIPTRSISISADGGEIKDSEGLMNEGIFSTEFTSDSEGIYEITAVVDSEILVINVTVKAETSVIITPKAEVNGNNVTVSVELTPSNITADLTFELDNTTYTIPVVNGTGSITLNALENGNYTIELKYAGDETYAPATKTLDFTVDNIVKNQSSVKVDVKTTDDGVEINVEVSPETATGNVTFTIDGKEYELELVDGKANTTISNLTEGNYTFNVKYSGDNLTDASVSDDISFTVEPKDKIVITADDLTKYFQGSERFVVTVTDAKGNPIANKTVIINLNGVSYTRTTNANGTTSMAIGLNAGIYNVTVQVDNVTVYSTVTVLSTINGTDLVKVFRNASQYYATFRDSEGNYLPDGTMVRFNINGVFYDRYVRGNEGLAKLNINLEQGEYIITAINHNTGEMHSNNITVIPRIIENNDLTKYFRNASQYTVKLIGDDGNAVGAGVEVTFNINGVFYTRTTNASGIAKLNINLEPGDYIITAEYAGCRVSNNIKVLPILEASDITMHYRDGTRFAAKLVDGQGNPLANEKVQFNINGVFYYRATDSDGIAYLNINLMSGQYIITSSYNGSNIANTVTVL